MTTITIIHEIRLAAETMVWLDDLVVRIAREVAAGALDRQQPGIPARDAVPPTGMTTISTGSAHRVGGAEVADDTRSGRAASASPIQFPQGNARPAGDEPAILDVSSQQLAPATASPERLAGASFGEKPILWSPERDAILKEGYPAGVKNSVLCERVNELPGRPVRLDQIVTRCMYLKLRRATGVVQRPTPEAEDDAPEVLERTADEIAQWCAFAKYTVAHVTEATLPAINAFRAKKGMPPYALIAKASPPPPNAPHRASYATILRWANQRGLCMDGMLDLAVVNAKAIALGAAPFELEEAPRRSVPSIIRHHQQGEPEHAP